VVALGLAYFLSAQVGLRLTHGGVVSPVWPPAGVAVAGLLVLGRRAWPGIAIASLTLGWHMGPLVALGCVAAQTLAPLTVATVLRSRPFTTSLARVGDVLHLVVVGAASMLLSAGIGTAALVWAGAVDHRAWARVGLVWWLGDTMGVVIVAPLLLTLSAPNPIGQRRGEAAALLAATAISTRLLFGGNLPLVFLVFPFALWAGLRLGPAVAAAVNTIVAGVAIWATAQGNGPFSTLSDTASFAVLETFNAGVAISSLVLAGAVSTAVRLTSENERLQAEIRTQLDEVVASRARIVQAAYTERRRVERDLHDGAQQRLVSLAYSLGLVLSRLRPGESPQLRANLVRASEDVKTALAELRALAQGIHPAVLTQVGLVGALESLAEQMVLPVDVEAPERRYPPVVEATAYFVASEALANVAKHAHATMARVTVTEADGRLVLSVADDGVGGADPARGSGLTGLVDRVAALEGRVRIDSPVGCGTEVRAELPCDWS